MKCCIHDARSSDVAGIGSGITGASSVGMASGGGMAVPKFPFPYPFSPHPTKERADSSGSRQSAKFSRKLQTLELGMSEAEAEADEKVRGGSCGDVGVSSRLLFSEEELGGGGGGTRVVAEIGRGKLLVSYQPSAKTSRLQQSK